MAKKKEVVEETKEETEKVFDEIELTEDEEIFEETFEELSNGIGGEEE